MGIQKILKGIYIGDIESLTRPQTRKENRIEAVLNCAYELRHKFISREKELYWYIGLYDCDWIRPWQIKSALEFIKLAKKFKGRILISCAGGASRSASIILAYMISQGWDMNEALLHMQKIRPVINPHPICLLSIRRYFKIPPY